MQLVLAASIVAMQLTNENDGHMHVLFRNMSCLCLLRLTWHKMRKWARNIASDTSLIISVRDSCPDFTDGFQIDWLQGILTDPHTHSENSNAEMQKRRNAEMQKCRNAEMQIYENLRTSAKDNKTLRKSTKVCEHLRKCRRTETRTRRHEQSRKCKKDTHYIEMRKSIKTSLLVPFCWSV